MRNGGLGGIVEVRWVTGGGERERRFWHGWSGGWQCVRIRKSGIVE